MSGLLVGANLVGAQRGQIPSSHFLISTSIYVTLNVLDFLCNF